MTPRQTMLALTGAIVTCWGRIEGSLFQDLLVTQHHPDVRTAGTCTPLPLGTKNVISTWIKATKLVGGNEGGAAEIDKMARELRECAEDRHVIVHAFWDYPHPDDADRSKLTVVKRAKGEPGKIEFAQYHLDVPKLAEMEKRFRSLYHKVMAFSFNLSMRVSKSEGHARHP